MKALDLVTDVYSQLDEDQDMIDPLQFGMFLVDWTDEKKLVDKYVVVLERILETLKLTMVSSLQGLPGWWLSE